MARWAAMTCHSFLPKPVAAGPRANPQEAIRRDYELALQLATRDAWEAFLGAIPRRFLRQPGQGSVEQDCRGRDARVRPSESEGGRAGEGEARFQSAPRRPSRTRRLRRGQGRRRGAGGRGEGQSRSSRRGPRRRSSSARWPRPRAARRWLRSRRRRRPRPSSPPGDAAEKAERAAKPAADRQIPRSREPESGARSRLRRHPHCPAADLAKSVQSVVRRVGCSVRRCRRRLERRHRGAR